MFYKSDAFMLDITGYNPYTSLRDVDEHSFGVFYLYMGAFLIMVIIAVAFCLYSGVWNGVFF